MSESEVVFPVTRPTIHKKTTTRQIMCPNKLQGFVGNKFDNNIIIKSLIDDNDSDDDHDLSVMLL